jgi:hypothetical protein
MTTHRAALLTVAATVAGLGGCAVAPRPAAAHSTDRLRCEDAAARAAARAPTQGPDEPRSSTAPRSVTAGGEGRAHTGATVVSAAATLGCLFLTPVFVLQAAATGDGTATARCSAEVASGAAPQPADDADASDSGRCPDAVTLAVELEAVAGCFAARDAPGDRRAALETLARLRWNGKLWTCLPAAQRARIEDARLRLLEAPATSAP